MDSNGGLITRDDLAKFHAETEQPRTGTYRGYTISKPGFWSQGRVMIQALNILEGFDLKKMGHNSPEYLHTVIEAVEAGFRRPRPLLRRPKFSKIPEETLLSKEYAAERRKLIDPQRASMESRPGTTECVGGHGGRRREIVGQGHDVRQCRRRAGQRVLGHAQRGMDTLGLVGDTGIPLSVRMETLLLTPGHANQLAPGKRPRVTLSPTIVTRDGSWL